MAAVWPTVWGGMPPFADHPDRACRDTATDVFFPEGGGSSGIAAAKAVCHFCPLIEACAAFAIPQSQLGGIWGGLTEPERVRIRLGKPVPVRKPPTPRDPARQAAASKASADARKARTAAVIAELAAAGLDVTEIVHRTKHSRRTVWRYLKQLRDEGAAA
jgi:WhiB family transcriptional regulator, redox-sensing transcriptional regulator